MLVLVWAKRYAAVVGQDPGQELRAALAGWVGITKYLVHRILLQFLCGYVGAADLIQMPQSLVEPKPSQFTVSQAGLKGTQLDLSSRGHLLQPAPSPKTLGKGTG